MGVAGLWDILRPAGQLRSLTHLSVKDGFEANPDGKRGFRVGIDASIWFYHAAYGKEGENPELRTLFFRCARLMEMPFLPVFVFDGPKRPDMKRGKRITGKNHWLVQGMQEIITAFGFEWRMAPGEAEAELAYLNRIGVIDAVLSDDVDTFLFGAKMVIRNKNATLSGNKGQDMKNSAGKDDGNHAMVYRSSDILNREDIQLTQGGLILIGVLRGGDYCQEGLEGCGPALAHGLAKCGFGDTLLATARTKTREELEEFLDGWRDEIRAELRTNARGHLPRKSPKLSRSIPDDFPNVDVVLAYTNPVTSEAKGRAYKNAVLNWDKEPDLGKIAGLCEMYFEWGLKDIIIKRFRNVLWPSAVLRILRRAAILKDRREARLAGTSGVPVTPRKNGKERRAPPGTPSSMIARHFSTMRLDSPHGSRVATLDEEDEDEEDESPLIVKIHSSRQHASTDKILEYRLEVAPAQLVRLCEAGLKGLRTAVPPDLTDSEEDGDEDDEEGGKKGKKKTKKPPPDPDSHLRIWLPACMVEMVEPEMVDEFEGVQKMKADKKAGKGTGKKGAASKAAAAPSATAAKKGKKAAATVAIVEEEEDYSGESSEAGSSKPMPPPKAKALQPAKKTSKPTAKASGSSDKAMDDFFMAMKPTAAAPANAAKATTSTAARVADLFKDIPASPKRKAHIPTFVDTSDDDEVPRPPILSRVSTKPTATSSTKSTSPSKAPSRILSLLDTTSHPSKSEPSSQAGPSRPKPKAAASAPAALPSASTSASTSSPSKPRTIRPFPMELDFFKEDSAQPSPVDEDLFTTDRVSSGSGSGYGFGSGSRSSSARTRSRSTVSSDSDSRESVLQKSPRRSEKHASPRGSPSKVAAKQKILSARREEEEESDGSRPPSPSPVKGRLPTTLSGRAGTRWEEEEEESDRAPSPSPARKRVLPPLNKPVISLGGARKHTPLPADLSIISISSDGSEDELPPLPPPKKVAPLQQVRARLSKTASASSARTTTSSTASASTQTSRKAPQRIYDPGDIIDLT
ncbi:hypothetical protein VTO73DRAFT_11088 [Trametes versicolor]